MREAALQYVRKVSGTRKPSRANEARFEAAVEQIAEATAVLLSTFEVSGPPRTREQELKKARARFAKRQTVPTASAGKSGPT